MDKISKLPPGIVYSLTGSDSPCWVTVGEYECRSFSGKSRGKRVCDPKKIIGRLPPDHLDATKWKEAYRLPKDYDPEKHELWWVSWEGPAHWEAVSPGRYVTGNPHWQRAEEAQPPPVCQKAHPGDQIEELKKELEEKKVWNDRNREAAFVLGRKLNELSMIFTGQPYDENKEYTRPESRYKGRTAEEWYIRSKKKEDESWKYINANLVLEAELSETKEELSRYKEDDTFLIWRGWTIKCANPKTEIGKGPPPTAQKNAKELITRPSVPALLDEIVRREVLDNHEDHLKLHADFLKTAWIPAKKKSSRFPEIAKWIATIGALGAGIWSIV